LVDAVEKVADEVGRAVRSAFESLFRPALIVQGQTTCCYSKSEKSWIDDPAGISWETFLTSGEATNYGDSVERAARIAAVTLARGFTTTFAGIAINHVPGFVVSQLVGAAIAPFASVLIFGTIQETK
jgi:hypothetical protein